MKEKMQFDFGNMFPKTCPICNHAEIRFNGYKRKEGNISKIIWKCYMGHVFESDIEEPKPIGVK